MRITTKILLLLVALTIGFSYSCQKVTSLENYGIVTSFEIDNSTLPSGVVLGETPVEIVTQNNKNYIYVNIYKGIHITPIEFLAKIAINEGADKLLNLPIHNAQDSLYSVTFENSSEPLSFYVIAASGMPVEWQIILRFEALSDEADITSFTLPATINSNITQNPDIDNITKSVTLYAVNKSLPITLYPKISYSELSKSSYNNAGMKFVNFTTPYNILVTAQSGFENNWTVDLVRPNLLTDPEQCSNEELSRMSLNKYTIKPQISSTLQDIPMAIDSASAIISLYLTSVDFTVENSINLNVTPVSGSQMAGETVISFSQANQTKFAYMIDTSIDTYREWRIKSLLISDNSIVVSGAKFDTFTAPDGIVVNPSSSVDSNSKEISFVVNSTQSTTSLSLLGVSLLLNQGATTNLPEIVTFNSLSDKIRFEVSSPNGENTEYWTLSLKGAEVGSEAELIDFSIGTTNIDWTHTYIEQGRRRVTVAVNQKEQLSFTPQFTLSMGATISSESGTINNNSISTAIIDTDMPFTVVSEDKLVREEWVMKFIYAPQLENRTFDDGLLNWGTANVSSPVKVVGTEVISRGDANGDAILCKTQEQDALLFGKLVAAGALFKGTFKMQLSLTGLQYPRTMTKFGTPFAVSTLPIAMNIDTKYISGTKMQQAIYDGSSKFSIVDKSGVDVGQVYIEMINYTANGGDMSLVPNSYSGFGKNGKGEPAEGVNVISRADLLMDGTDATYNNWVNNQTIPFENFTSTLPVTHIVIVAASSKSGDIYLGAIGSQLSLDNIVMTYYVPESGAVTKTRE